MSPDRGRHDYLKRLPANYYRGGAWVHWTMTIKDRTTGWLDRLMHLSMREELFHTLARYRLVCPAYVLMPDHAHFLWCGCSSESDQLRASSFFRRQWNECLKRGGAELQKQGHDHVLLESERNPEAFEDTCVYIMRNPEQAALVTQWRDWEYSGSLVPGYPWIDLRKEGFWGKFWDAYSDLRDPGLLP